MIKLQNIIYPSIDNCTEESLYFRRFGDIKYSFADNSITMGMDSMLLFDTYFNGFSISKWYKYTNVEKVFLRIKVKGKFRISLLYKERQADQILERVVDEEYVDTEGSSKNVDCEFNTENMQGQYSFCILSLIDDSIFYDGFYYTNLPQNEIRDVNLSIIVCTYKREKYVYKNVCMLKKNFLERNDAELSEHLKVVIVDNAKTLNSDNIEGDNIHVFINKNVGGSGGFARGLVECISNSELRDTTHVLMMDDDVIIQPESVYRTYKVISLLKPKYHNAFVGGAMIRTDKQWLQEESGGCWNSGHLISHKQGVDLRTLDGCLYNEIEEKCEFNAWWYCAMPIGVIAKENLPLPIFIRGDDIEYGLRNMKYLILMNGICVWHEPFEFKYSSSMYYYVMRNRLIDNAIHQLPYSKKEFIQDFKEQFFREVFTLRYKNAWLLLDGVNDFYKGIDWLKDQDGEQLNQQIIERGYKLQYVDELSLPFDFPKYEQTIQYVEDKRHQWKRKCTLNGLFQNATHMVIAPVINPHIAYFYRVSVALNYDYSSRKGFETYRSRKEFFDLCIAYIRMKRDTYRKFERVFKEYKERKNEITCIEFWNKYLHLVE
ncbi:MAG: glycosyltransferase family 2 protein [Lachnospiraceae bacterium]|nr:glycosyltransferase family 2 protein [Lachnospiraceae bacterium]